jgi:release factor glutamine methyltransferase
MNVGQLLSRGYEILKAEGISSYIIDCELLLGKVLKKDKLFFIVNRDYEVDSSNEEEYFRLVDLRKNKMPVKYILGECEFMGLSFIVREGVLIPRPDTETLVEEAIKEIKKNNFTEVLDLCCGSGAVGISLAYYNPMIRVTCSDISNVACDTTIKNVLKFNLLHRVSVKQSDLMEFALKDKIKYQMVVANPPYISDDDVETLMEDVKNYEPYIALSGGADGLDFYRKITDQSLKVLETGGILIFETGHDQREAVSKILKLNGFSDVECIKDLAGKDRVVKGRLL